MDGTTQESYEQYRRRGDLDTVLANIRRINAWKKELDSEFPKLTLQFIVFGFNEHQIEDMKALAAELGAEVYFKASWDADFSPLRDPAGVAKATGLQRTTEQEHKLAWGPTALEARICSQLWNTPQVHPDGEMLGCCVNLWGSFGNVKERSFAEVFRGETMTYARNMLLGRVPSREDIPCTKCHNYQKMHAHRAYLTEEMVADPESAEAAGQRWWHPLAEVGLRTKRALGRLFRTQSTSRDA